MKKSLLSLCISFLASASSFANDGTADSVLAIKHRTTRFNVLVKCYSEIQSHTKAETAFLNTVLQKGDAAEKLLARFVSENKALPSPADEARVALCKKYLPLALANGDAHLLSIIYFQSAFALMSLERYREAFESYLSAYDYVKKDPEQHFFGSLYGMYQTAVAFYVFNEYDSTINITRQLATLPAPGGIPPSWFYVNNANLEGMSYYWKGNYDSAKANFTRAMPYARQYIVEAKDSIWVYILTGNLGLSAYQQKDYTLAATLLKKASEWCYANQQFENSVRFAPTLAKLYTMTGRLNDVPQLLKESAFANDAFYKLGNRPGYFEAAYLYYQKIGEWKTACSFSDSVRKYDKLMATEYNKSKLVLAESRVAMDKKNAEAVHIAEKLKQEKQLRYGALALALAVSLSVILFYQRKKLQYQLKKEKLELENVKVEEDLYRARYELQEFKNTASYKNKLLEYYITEVESLKEQTKHITDAQYQAIEDLRSMNVLTDEDWNSFRNTFEKVYPGFIERLKIQYPALTPAETRYAVFTKLNIGSKEMASMLGISAEGLRNIRFRLLKKTELADVKELEKVVECL